MENIFQKESYLVDAFRTTNPNKAVLYIKTAKFTKFTKMRADEGGYYIENRTQIFFVEIGYFHFKLIALSLLNEIILFYQKKLLFIINR